jgi:hypothetical protein
MSESENTDLYRMIIEKGRNEFHEDFLKNTGHTISELEKLRNIVEPGMEKGEVKFKANKKGGGFLKFDYLISETKEKVIKTLKVEDKDLAAFFAGLQAEVQSKTK